MIRKFSTIFAGLLLIAVAGVMAVATQPSPANSDDTTVTVVDGDTDEPLEEDGEIGEGIVVDNDEPVSDEPIDDVLDDDFDPWVDGDADGVTEYGSEVHEFPADYDGGITDEEPEGCAP
jgi:hypothetical protein